MSVEREYAVVGETIILRVEFVWTAPDGAEVYYDPSSLGDVDILDGSNTVVATVSSGSIVRDSTGKYHVSVGPFSAETEIYDRWTYYNSAGGHNFLHVGAVLVRADVGDGSPSVPAVVSQTHISIFSKGTKSVLAGVTLYVYEVNDQVVPPFAEIAGDYVWSGVTSTDGRVSPVLNVGSYYVVLEYEDCAFTRNAFQFEVDGVGVERFFFYTTPVTAEAPVTNDISTTNTCLVSFYFGLLDGSPLANRRVLLETHSSTVVAGTLGATIVVPSGLSVELRLNASGSGSRRFVRGTIVDVYLEGSTFRRRVTIPDAATANFSSLAGDDDYLSLVAPTIPSADVDVL